MVRPSFRSVVTLLVLSLLNKLASYLTANDSMERIFSGKLLLSKIRISLIYFRWGMSESKASARYAGLSLLANITETDERWFTGLH
jgi:hypothetical protein